VSATQSTAPAARRRILLVEDEAHMMEMLKFRLEESGYAVATAADGYAALAQVRTFKPELIILDLMIPKIDGYTICRLLKFNDEMKEIPVMILSARSTEEDVRRGLAMGANAYVTKPYEAPVLLAKIHELLNPPPPEPAVEEPPAESAPGPAA
jgi:DNA-binding response OmpR family regulator